MIRENQGGNANTQQVFSSAMLMRYTVCRSASLQISREP